MRQKEFPKELIINGNLWRVRFVRSLKEHDTNSTECDGLCDPSDRVIYIRQRQTEKERLDTYFHELSHAICFEYDIEVAHKIIHKIGHAMASVSMDNF